MSRWGAALGLTLVSGLSGVGTDHALAEQVLPLGETAGWQLVFEDEFAKAPLDRSSWTTCYWWNKNGCTNLSSGELQWYLPANVSVESGELRLKAARESAMGIEGRTFEYTSGMVTTGRDYDELPGRPRHEFLYGHVEVSARPPKGRGLWPAVWLLPSSRESKPEIDVMEILGHKPHHLEMHYHFKDGDGDHSVGHAARTVDLSEDWHVYGLTWDTDKIVWYLDGQEQWRFEDAANIPREPMYLLMNLAVGGRWPGNPDASTVFPSDFRIKSVRVWKRTE